jgi:hypothetical protein
MNKGGEFGDILKDNVIFLILLALYVVGIGLHIAQQEDGAGVWENYYSKEIVKFVNFAEVGDEICLDVNEGVKIAINNEVSKSQIFSADNRKNEICVKLSQGRKSCFSYFNEVDVVITEESLKLAGGINEDGKDVNIWCFNMVRPRGEESV